MKSLVFSVNDSSAVSEVRMAALDLAKEEGLTAELAGSAALVATEAATNLVKHAHNGEIHLAPLSGRGSPGVEMLAMDSGPGIGDLEHWLHDGRSTAGTAGTGFGAIRRSSQVFDVYSAVGKGTAMLSQVTIGKSGALLDGHIRMGIVKRALAGQDCCGDDWAVSVAPDSLSVMVADGLGHGLDASVASSAAVEAFLSTGPCGPGEHLLRIHNKLKSTRGAAVAVARSSYQEGRVIFTGLGNICGMVVGPTASQSMVSLYGTCGHSARKIQEFTYPLPQNALVVMHSDGLSAQWSSESDPGLLRCHPSLIAAVLYQRAVRARDDACIIALKKDVL